MDEESCFLLIVASFLYTVWFTGKTNFTLLNLKTVYRNIKVFCGNQYILKIDENRYELVPKRIWNAI